MCWCRLRQITYMYEESVLILGADIATSWKSVHPICAPVYMCTSLIYAFKQNQPDAYVHVTHSCIWLLDYYFMCESQQRTDGDENEDENTKPLKIPKLKSCLAAGKVLGHFHWHTAMYMLQCCYVWTLVQIAWSTQRGCYTGTLHLLSSFIFSSVSRLSSFKHPRALVSQLSPHHLPSIVLSLSLSLSTFLPPQPAISVSLSLPSINFSVCSSAVRHSGEAMSSEWGAISSKRPLSICKQLLWSRNWQTGVATGAPTVRWSALHVCLLWMQLGGTKGGTNIYMVIL